MRLMQPGDEFIAARKLYGGSINQFTHAFKSFGWHVNWADPDDPDSFERAVHRKTKAIFIELIANPGGIITDIEAIAAMARQAGVPLIVDNTLASPYLIRPIDYGADIVVHSADQIFRRSRQFDRRRDRRWRQLRLVEGQQISLVVGAAPGI